MADDLVQRLRAMAGLSLLRDDIHSRPFYVFNADHRNTMTEAADAIARKDAEIAELRLRVESQDDALDEVMKERDWAQDCLQETHIALGGDGEWTGKMPGEPPPDSGDLHYDVPILAGEVFARAERAEARVDALEESTHYANGVAELAMKHRDAAEARIAGAAVADAGAVFRSLGLPVGRELDGKRVALVLLDTEEAK